MKTGPSNSLTDVRGLRVGHATFAGGGRLTGVTVVVAPPGGATGGVDVRGGGPGTRETDLLDPRNNVERVHAVVLGGGSAYGLAAAHGVMTRLAADGRGIQMGPDPSHVVPIVPAAILFDLGRGGVFGNYPGSGAGEAAYDAAMSTAGAGPVPAGNAGAGTGALAGQLKGGIGAASTVLTVPEGTGAAGRPGLDTADRPSPETAAHPAPRAADHPSPETASRPGPETAGGLGLDNGARGEVTVAALAAVNAVGSVLDERTGVLYGAQYGLPGEFDWLRTPDSGEVHASTRLLGSRSRGDLPRPLNTTIGVIATDANLTKAQCARLAGVAHDGLARAIRPAHSMFDGDTIFALATGDGPPPTPQGFHVILAAAADCFARAIVHGILAAEAVTTPDGRYPSYLDVFPSAGKYPGAARPRR